MKLPEFIKGVIFDLDGTLLDSLRVWQTVDRNFFELHGIPLPDDYYHAIKAMELREAADYTKKRFSFPESRDDMIATWQKMVQEEYALRVGLKPYTKELLAMLKKRGMKLAVATSSSREIFLPCLERLKIAEEFLVFTETREAKRGKQFPDPYLLAAERLNLAPEECAVFEDIAVGVKSAKSAGFYTVAVADPEGLDDEAEKKRCADLFLSDFSQLL